MRHHHQGGCKQQKRILLLSEAPSQGEEPAGPWASEGSRGGFSGGSPSLWGLPVVLGLWLHHSKLCLWLQSHLLLCLS